MFRFFKVSDTKNTMKPLNTNVNRHTFPSTFTKFAVCFLFLGLAYSLFSSSFVQFSPVVVTTTGTAFDEDKALPPNPPISSSTDLSHENRTSRNEKCNVFVGNWIHDPTGPFYTNATCSSIEEHQNCMRNGRPDTDYVYWRWKPKDCDLPRFDSKRFLNMMRGKSLAFIGDSIMRNHVQSLLCMLSQVEQAMATYHDEQYKSRRWVFPSHGLTLSVIWSPFLTKASVFEDPDGIIQLHLDDPDATWTDQYRNFDYVVIAGGKWFLRSAIYLENNTIVGCHNCRGKNITQVGFYYAYRKALNSTLKFITSSNHKAYTFFRTTTPDHFENGEWNTGGYCNRTRPFREGEIDVNDIDGMLRNIELEEFERAAAIGSGKDVTLTLFDTTSISLLRPDGHPGVYRKFHPYSGKDKRLKLQNDCLHWCLPGPIDSWNDLMMEMLVNG